MYLFCINDDDNVLDGGSDNDNNDDDDDDDKLTGEEAKSYLFGPKFNADINNLFRFMIER